MEHIIVVLNSGYKCDNYIVQDLAFIKQTIFQQKNVYEIYLKI